MFAGPKYIGKGCVIISVNQAISWLQDSVKYVIILILLNMFQSDILEDIAQLFSNLGDSKSAEKIRESGPKIEEISVSSCNKLKLILYITIKYWILSGNPVSCSLLWCWWQALWESSRVVSRNCFHDGRLGQPFAGYWSRKSSEDWRYWFLWNKLNHWKFITL